MTLWPSWDNGLQVGHGLRRMSIFFRTRFKERGFSSKMAFFCSPATEQSQTGWHKNNILPIRRAMFPPSLQLLGGQEPNSFEGPLFPRNQVGFEGWRWIDLVHLGCRWNYLRVENTTSSSSCYPSPQGGRFLGWQRGNDLYGSFDSGPLGRGG
jgi:hypothetical protein